ncbi:MAG: dienelactone hydrolase family protein [Holosporaceae bacterium]|jgi:phospholipase/carboxylesterase|nr:dienelactone hydrolase family protein [Holosporaceae bacterium]
MDEIVLEARSNVAKCIFIFHGYGADKNNLRPIGEEFSKIFPEAEIHLPNGIESCDDGFGRQWFPLKDNDIKMWEQAFEKNASHIISYVDTVISQKNLDYKDIIFAGFSQGAMLSLSLGLKYEVKAVIAFSGLLLNPNECVHGKNTKIFLAHGKEDTIIPIDAMRSAEETLKKAGIDVKIAISSNLSHGIDNYLLKQAIDFLKML